MCRRSSLVECLVLVSWLGCTDRQPDVENRHPDRFSAQPLSASVVGTTTGPIAEGAQTCHRKGCLYCHRIENAGGYRGPSLTTIGDRLSGNQMIIRILNGGTNMPAYGDNTAPGPGRRLPDFSGLALFARPQFPGVPPGLSRPERLRGAGHDSGYTVCPRAEVAAGPALAPARGRSEPRTSRLRSAGHVP